MNWIQGIQKAIDYVEENICKDVDFEEVAKRAYSSSFHFQRVFGILCGFQLGDYIRMRRLSLAAEELSTGNAKIIDTALKYGYDTPESFSRAFTKFHGVSPSAAKHGGKVKIFTPLSVKLILTGGTKMDYRIEKRDAFDIVCKRKTVEKPQSASAASDITAMWDELGANGTLERIISLMPKCPVMKGLLGICFSSELNSKKFPLRHRRRIRRKKSRRRFGSGYDSRAHIRRFSGKRKNTRCLCRNLQSHRDGVFPTKHPIRIRRKH